MSAERGSERLAILMPSLGGGGAQDAGGRAYDYAEVVAALARGIAETWEVDLLPGQLTAAERHLSTHLCTTKYHSEAWTWHR